MNKNTSHPEPLVQVMETCLYADDLDAAEQFYHGLLGLEVIAQERGRHVFFRCGQGVILVFIPAVTSTEQTYINGDPIPLHGASGAGHLAFAVTSDQLDAWRVKLEQVEIPIESHIRWPQRGESIYIRDPAGNSVEFVTPELWESPTN